MIPFAKVAISWSGLPFYGARLIRAGIKKLGCPVTVLASKAKVPVAGIDEELGQAVHWIDPDATCAWSKLGLEIPGIFFQSGWTYRAFNMLGREVRRHGGKVILLADNNWRNNFKQWLGALIFRAYQRKWFDAVWVPGRSGKKFFSFLGMPKEKIYQGCYGADPAIFRPGPPLSKREKKFLFVGQFIRRKRIDLLVQSFRKFGKEFPDWSLEAYGNGPLAPLLELPGITSHSFQQSRDIAKVMQESRFLILPSRKDHWPLVIHEAALCGCGLIVSDRVGSLRELVSEKNGFIFKRGSSDDLFRAMVRAAEMSDDELDQVFLNSRQMAASFGPQVWGETFVKIISDYAKQERPY